MAIMKCKMCGGELNFTAGETVGTCDYCGTKQTLPKSTDENLQSLFNRANVLRMKADFDKAADIYEKILQVSGTEAEAYWGLVLCKYGIEYVEDPATFKRIPTCHRASFDAVVADDDYKMAVQYADIMQKELYEEQAKQIDEIQKGIIALAQKEEPYDVFICYKETDESGKRTQDSVIANDIYHQLTQEGFKVFYAAITLEDKLGQEYEPYIFSALNSAKVMLALGTKPEYFNAVWVKNEWSRFLKIMKKDRARMLIPCYRDMDAYELPEEFAHLQAQDMSKIGFISDVVRGIKKVIVKEDSITTSEKEKIVVQNVGNLNVEAQLKRGNMALEDREWEKADQFFEEVLNQDAENGIAYLGKFLASVKAYNFENYIEKISEKEITDFETNILQAGISNDEHINEIIELYAFRPYLDRNMILNMYTFDFGYGSCTAQIEEFKQVQLEEIRTDKNIVRVKKYADSDICNMINENLRFFEKKCNDLIEKSKQIDLEKEKEKKIEYEKFITKVDERIKAKYELARIEHEKKYKEAINLVTNANGIQSYEDAKKALLLLNGYKDSLVYIKECEENIDRIKREEEENYKKQAILRRKKEKRTKLVLISIIVLIIISGVFYFVVENVIAPRLNFKREMDTIKNAQVGDIVEFGKNEDSKDSVQWRILDKKDNKCLLISEYVFDKMSYEYSETFDTTWEKCSIRSHMEVIYSICFNEREQSQIVETLIHNEDNSEYGTDGGNDTQDKIFILSIDEVDEYFDSAADRMATFKNSENESIRWWLRSPGRSSREAAYIAENGRISSEGCNVKSMDDCAVRPAMWIKVD